MNDWSDSDEWRNLKVRLDTLFSVLGKVGCFILKKGTIESYYQYSSISTSNGKPSAAADEVGELSEREDRFIRDKYSDVIRALEYAALTKSVDESYAVKKELLSELALILEILPIITSENEIYSAIKQAKGSASSLFKYKIINADKLGVEVSLSSTIIDVTGFPFHIQVGDNVNSVVGNVVKPKI